MTFGRVIRLTEAEAEASQGKRTLGFYLGREALREDRDEGWK